MPDATRIFVDVGLNFHVQMTLPEAIAFLDEKEAYLEALLEQRAKRTAQVKADVHQFLHILGIMNERGQLS